MEQIRATISVYNREGGIRKEGKIGGASWPVPPSDWLINIKMPVLVNGIVYIYYGRYMDREGGVIVSDCYSYSAGSHATEHQCALLCWLDISEKKRRGARVGMGGPGVLPSQ